MVITRIFQPQDWRAGFGRGLNAQIAFSKCRSSAGRDVERQDCPNCGLEISGHGTANGAQARYRWRRPRRSRGSWWGAARRFCLSDGLLSILGALLGPQRFYFRPVRRKFHPSKDFLITRFALAINTAL